VSKLERILNPHVQETVKEDSITTHMLSSEQTPKQATVFFF